MFTCSSSKPPPDDQADSKPNLEHLFSQYAMQRSIMQNLNLYDFENVQLAGCRVPVTSTALQKQLLIPIYCNELRYTFDSVWECGNTPEALNEMRLCQGLSLGQDDSELNIGPWEPCFEHDDRDPNNFFWVCSHCRYESKEYYQWNISVLHQRLHTSLCERHSLEYY